MTRISDEIQSSVAAYAGSRTGRRRAIIAQAVDLAVRQWVAIVDGEPTAPGRVHALFVTIGRGEAADGHDLDAMQAAFQVATRIAEESIHRHAGDVLDLRDSGILSHALLTYMTSLIGSVAVGYKQECRHRATNPRHLRDQLFDLIVSGGERPEVEGIAALLNWTVPDEVMICGLDVDAVDVIHLALPDDVQRRLRHGRVLAIVDASDSSEILEQLVAWPRLSPVAHMGPMPMDRVRLAVVWVERMLDIVRNGHLSAYDRIDCDAHRMTLLVSADQHLYNALCQDLLRPLDEVAPGRRARLVATMRAWLGSHEPLHQIADRLGVHVNTLSARIREIVELFGPRLETDPEYVCALMVALNADHADSATLRTVSLSDGR